MQWIMEMTYQQWMYVLANTASIIGLLYAACSSMFVSDENILIKSYNVLPYMKIYGMNKENIILNLPGDIVLENLKENTSIFLGFIVSVIGFILDTIMETQEIPAKQLLILAVPLSVVCYLILYVLSLGVAYLRLLIIINKINKNKILPKVYNVFETDNIDGLGGEITSRPYSRQCTWERKVVNGVVQDKIE